MKPNYLPALGLVATLIIMTGCSDRSSPSTGAELPAPSRSTDAARSPESAPPEDDSVVTPQDAERTEFAALDTNSDGMLEEDEWESEDAENLANLKNMNFAQIDRNSNGGIEPEEFRKARTSGDTQVNTGTGTDTAVGDSGTESLDPGGP